MSAPATTPSRAGRTPVDERHESPWERLDRNTVELLGELRVALKPPLNGTISKKAN